jgi:hypothetical protein
MKDLICKRLAFWATVCPLPTLALSLVFAAIRSALSLDFLGILIAALLLISGISYLASLVLTIVCGFVSKSTQLLFPPFASLLLIALFVIFLPEKVREDPWRTSDIFIFVGLILFNIVQMLSLRRRSLVLIGRNPDRIR